MCPCVIAVDCRAFPPIELGKTCFITGVSRDPDSYADIGHQAGNCEKGREQCSRSPSFEGPASPVTSI